MTRPERSRRARVLRQIAIATVATLIVLELGARAVSGRWLDWGPEGDRGGHWVVDPALGYVPGEGLHVRVRDAFTITTREHGTRSNGDAPPAREHPRTLVVGDSFAFGDEVDDHDSWPAILEQVGGSRVINAAVPGFGLDQAVLRAERLASLEAPDRIIVSFIPHDVRRCELSIWSGNAKPYFDLDGSGRLVAHPAPSSSTLALRLATPLSHSVLLDSLFHDLLQRDGPDTVVHHRGPEVACALTARLAQLGRDHDAEVVVVAQPQTPLPNEPRYPDFGAPPRRDDEIVATVLACAREEGLATLDLIPVVAALPPADRARLFRGHGHNSPEGNRLIANEIAAFLGAMRF